MGGITNKTVHLSFAVDWSKEVNPLLKSVLIFAPISFCRCFFIFFESACGFTAKVCLAGDVFVLTGHACLENCFVDA
jgi:hypothetical protein